MSAINSTFNRIETKFEKGDFKEVLNLINNLPSDIDNENSIRANIWKNEVFFLIDDDKKKLQPIIDDIKKIKSLNDSYDKNFLLIKALLCKKNVLSYLERNKDINNIFKEIYRYYDQIKNEESKLLENNKLKLYIDFEYGRFLEDQGNYLEAIEMQKNTIKEAKLQGVQYIASFSARRIGWCYYNLGNLNQSILYLEESLHYCDDIDNLILQGHTLNALGIVNVSLGNYKKGLKYYFTSFEKLKSQAKDYYLIGAISGNIGWFYLHKGEYMAAEDFFLLELSYYETKFKYYNGLANCYVGLIELHLAEKSKVKALDYLKKLEKLTHQNKNWIVQSSYYYGKALILIHIKKKHGIIEAKQLLEKIVAEKKIALIITYFAQFKIVDLLIRELEVSQNQDIFNELDLTKLKKNTKSEIIKSIIAIFEAKLLLIQGNIEKTREIYEETLILTNKNGLKKQGIFIEKELKTLNKNQGKWQKSIANNLILYQKMQIQQLKSSFEKIMEMIPNQ